MSPTNLCTLDREKTYNPTYSKEKEFMEWNLDVGPKIITVLKIRGIIGMPIGTKLSYSLKVDLCQDINWGAFRGLSQMTSAP